MNSESPSRQARWQQDRIARGLCSLCGQLPLAADSARLCAPCRAKDRERARQRYWDSGRAALKRYHREHPGAKWRDQKKRNSNVKRGGAGGGR